MISKLGALVLGICLLSCFLPVAENANIVFFFGISSYSHRVPAWPLAEALAEKGHNVTFISPFPAKNPNAKIFDYVPTKLKEWLDNLEDMENVFEDRKNNDMMKGWTMLPAFGVMMCEEIYKDENYVNWVKSTKVDLLFLDGLANDCAYGMAHYWGSKVILFDTSSPFSHFPEVYGLPDETSWIPSFELYYSVPMSFLERLANALVPVYWHYVRTYSFFPKLEQITREKLGTRDLPNFAEIERNTSLVFLNTHYGEEFARSLPPNTIPIGGIAYKENRKPLPKELDNFLKKGDGFIYMSFGTYGDFLQLDRPIQQAFIRTMDKLAPLQFVWKVSNESFLEEFPKKNVYISKWMPQQDILAHPKIKAFITHSGLMGIQEAVYNSVPLISFPIFAEQDYNAERIHRKEYGIRLEITTVTGPQLEDAITKVITDPKYRNNMKTVSMLFKERPQKPLDTALWWTDFVLRHSQEEVAALRPMNAGMPWWQRRQLDVWAVLLGSVFALLLTLTFVVYKLLKSVFGKSASSAATLNVKNQRKKVQ